MGKHTIFLSISLPFITILLYLPLTTTFQTSSSITKYTWLFNNSILIHLLTTLSLSFAASQSSKNAQAAQSRIDQKKSQPREDEDPSPSPTLKKWILTTRLIGILSGTYILTLPIFYPVETYPLLDCLLRVATFFSGCKLLDLSVARASSPPVFLAGNNAPDSWLDRLAYTCLLTTSTRYAAFDVAVKTGTSLRREKGSWLWEYGPVLVIPLTVLLPQIAEFKVLSGLVVIQLGLEGLHWIFHGSNCQSGKLFHYPFAARTLSEFWGVRWHQGAQPFLLGLGYFPAQRVAYSISGNREAGRAAGVLAAFGLSGIWHGWCATSLVKEEFAWSVGVGLWAVFVLQGVGCLAEKVIWGKRQGGWVQRVVVWAYAVEVGAMWFRGAEKRRVEIPWVERLMRG